MGFVFLAMLFFLVQNISNKEFSARFRTDTGSILRFQLIAHVGMTLALGLAKLTTWKEAAVGFPAAGVLLGVLYGLTYLTAIMCLIKAMSVGPVGSTILIVNMSLVLSVSCSVLFFGERITPVHALGFPCVLLALALSALGGGNGQKANWRWLALALITFFADGTLAIIQKAFTYSYPEASTELFLLISAAAGLALCAGLSGAQALRSHDRAKTEKRGLFAGLALAVGVSTIVATAFNMRALGVVDASIVMPVRQGGLILAVALYGILRYKEKFDLKTGLMFAFGIAGLVMFNL